MESEKPSFARFGEQGGFASHSRPMAPASRGGENSRPAGVSGEHGPSKKTVHAFDWIITGVLMLLF
ncbi:MAG: hypothetical protein ABI747_03750, partial [Candidatus Moraniibacteriota bacterium]